MNKLPFPHYPGSADAAAGAGGKAVDQQATFSALKANLSGQSDAASQQVGGVLTSPVSGSTVCTEQTASDAAAAALVAGGAINHFAAAITTYDRHVDDLNARYETAKADDFGVAADAGLDETASDAQNDRAHADAVDQADAVLQQELERERQRYENDLDDAADHTAALLATGPSEATVLSLYATGDISANAAADVLGGTVEQLNRLRKTLATAVTVTSWKDNLPALAAWLRHRTPENLDALRASAAPGNILGKYGYLGTHRATPPATWLKAASNTGRVIGKWLPPAAVVAGAYGFYETWRNRDDLSWDEEVNGYVGSGATTIGGGAAIAIWAGYGAAALPPVAVVAGVVAVGSLAYTYRHEIADGLEWTGDKIAEGWHNTAEWTGDRLDDAEEIVDDVGDDLEEGLEDTGEAIDDGLDEAGDVIDDVTPDIDAPW